MKAAIDIGTNTVLLLVAEIRDGVIKPIHEEHRVPRLGKGVDEDKNINEAATRRVIEALKEYRKILEVDFPETENVIVTATSAVRDASNRSDFIQQVKEETGFQVKLLSGREEAEWTSAGAFSVLTSSPEKETLILDIGGGSTEVARVEGGKVLDGHSFNMGSVRFTERFLAGNPPSPKEIAVCRKEIDRLYESRLFKVKGEVEAVGVAGTVTTLAGMALGLQTYQPEKLNRFSISLRRLREIMAEFEKHPCEEMLAKHPVYLKGRDDIFFAGMLILEEFLVHFGLDCIRVSTGGIRHGAILMIERGQ